MATGETINCCFCPATFSDQSEFWEHMGKGDCGVAVGADADYESSPKQTPKQQPIPSMIVRESPQSNVPPDIPPRPSPLASFGPPPSQSVPFPGRHEPCNSPEVNGCTSMQSPSPSTALTAVAAAAIDRYYENPPPRVQQTSPPASKWKCTVCDLYFADKDSLLAHVKTPEHTSKIVISRSASGPSLPSIAKTTTLSTSTTTAPTKAPAPHPPPSTANMSTPSSAVFDRNELTAIVRQVVREELPSLIRRELRNVFNAALSEPKATTASTSSYSPLLQKPKNSGVVELDDGYPFIEVRPKGYYCVVCQLAIPSVGHLPGHVGSKKHFAAVEKLSK